MIFMDLKSQLSYFGKQIWFSQTCLIVNNSAVLSVLNVGCHDNLPYFCIQHLVQLALTSHYVRAKKPQNWQFLRKRICNNFKMHIISIFITFSSFYAFLHSFSTQSTLSKGALQYLLFNTSVAKSCNIPWSSMVSLLNINLKNIFSEKICFL